MTTEPPYRTTLHPLGFRRLDPLPDPAVLQEFYGEEYYEGLNENPRRGADLTRLKGGGRAALLERNWLEATVYEDIRHHLGELGHSGGHLLDIGCGTGEFLESMRSAGWVVAGSELSNVAASECAHRDLLVEQADVQALSATRESEFDVITMLNVLEHVRDPIGDLEATHRLLRPEGCLVVQVPNDFSILQRVASEQLDANPWWIAVPDHLNYFDYESLERAVGHVGFEACHRSGSFPMELFLLLGSNYLADSSIGSTAHALRRDLELKIQPSTRREMASAFAAAGMGRNCLLIAKKRSDVTT